MAKTYKKPDYLEQIIAITLLSVPEFREAAGLPPLALSRGETCATIAAVSGLTRQRINFIEQNALRKIRAYLTLHPYLLNTKTNTENDNTPTL